MEVCSSSQFVHFGGFLLSRPFCLLSRTMANSGCHLVFHFQLIPLMLNENAPPKEPKTPTRRPLTCLNFRFHSVFGLKLLMMMLHTAHHPPNQSEAGTTEPSPIAVTKRMTIFISDPYLIRFPAHGHVLLLPLYLTACYIFASLSGRREKDAGPSASSSGHSSSYTTTTPAGESVIGSAAAGYIVIVIRVTDAPPVDSRATSPLTTLLLLLLRHTN